MYSLNLSICHSANCDYSYMGFMAPRDAKMKRVESWWAVYSSPRNKKYQICKETVIVLWRTCWCKGGNVKDWGNNHRRVDSSESLRVGSSLLAEEVVEGLSGTWRSASEDGDGLHRWALPRVQESLWNVMFMSSSLSSPKPEAKSLYRLPSSPASNDQDLFKEHQWVFSKTSLFCLHNTKYIVCITQNLW